MIKWYMNQKQLKLQQQKSDEQSPSILREGPARLNHHYFLYHYTLPFIHKRKSNSSKPIFFQYLPVFKTGLGIWNFDTITS